MTEFVKRVGAAIEASRKAGEYFTNGRYLMALVPGPAFPLAIGDINNFIASSGAVKVDFKPTPPTGEPDTSTVQTLIYRGVTCHIIEAQVRQELFVVASPIQAGKGDA